MVFIHVGYIFIKEINTYIHDYTFHNFSDLQSAMLKIIKWKYLEINRL